MKTEPSQPSRTAIAWATIRAYVTWPATVRALKRNGWVRTGWMTWQYPPPDRP